MTATPSAVLGREWWRSAAALAPEPARGVLAFRCLLLFTGVLIVAPQTLLPELAPFRLALVSATGAAVAHVYDRFVHRAPLVPPTLTSALIVALLAWATATAPLSYWSGGSFALMADLYLKAVLVFWLLGGVVDSSTRLFRLVRVLCALAVPLALTAVRNYAAGTFYSEGVVRRIVGYDAPLTQNPNDLALMLNLLLPLMLALLLGAESALARLWLLLAALLSVAAIVLTFSRAGFLCLALTTVTSLTRLVRRGRLGWLGVVGVAAALGVVLLPEGYGDRLSTIGSMDSDPTRSAQLRWADMVLATDYMLEHPLVGAGIGMNLLALNDLRGPAWKEVHNAYLQYGVDLGFPGLMLFVGALASSFSNVRAAERRCRAHPDAASLARLAEGVRGSLLVLAVAAMFHPIAYQFFFFYFAGLAVALRGVAEREVAA